MVHKEAMRSVIKRLGISQNRAAKILDVSANALGSWLNMSKPNSVPPYTAHWVLHELDEYKRKLEMHGFVVTMPRFKK